MTKYCSFPPARTHYDELNYLLLVDVDECHKDNGGCINGKCINYKGGHQCVCRPGFKLVGQTCIGMYTATCRRVNLQENC